MVTPFSREFGTFETSKTRFWSRLYLQIFQALQAVPFPRSVSDLASASSSMSSSLHSHVIFCLEWCDKKSNSLMGIGFVRIGAGLPYVATGCETMYPQVCLNEIRKVAWLFCRTSSGVRLCWELEEPKGPKKSRKFAPFAQRSRRTPCRHAARTPTAPSPGSLPAHTRLSIPSASG